MRRFFLIPGIIVLSLGLIMACGQPEEPQKSPRPAAKPKKSGQDGTPKLQVYDEPGMAIKTEYPAGMKVEGTGSGEGSALIFSFKPPGNALDQARVHIFLPRGAATAAAQEPFVTGPRGLLESNGWKKTGETGDTREFPYRWVRKIISFSAPGKEGMMGKILLGETHGQAVQVILYYPKDTRKEFLTKARIILKNLSFKPEKLPLGKSQ